MLDNINKTLADCLTAVTDWERHPAGSVGEAEAAERATSAIAALDLHLSNGGALPDRWWRSDSAEARYQVTSKNAEIARLKAQLDQYHKDLVLNATEQVCLEIIIGVREFGHEKDSVILRATDTGQEWRLSNGVWEKVAA